MSTNRSGKSQLAPALVHEAAEAFLDALPRYIELKKPLPKSRGAHAERSILRHHDEWTTARDVKLCAVASAYGKLQWSGHLMLQAVQEWDLGKPARFERSKPVERLPYKDGSFVTRPIERGPKRQHFLETVDVLRGVDSETGDWLWDFMNLPEYARRIYEDLDSFFFHVVEDVEDVLTAASLKRVGAPGKEVKSAMAERRRVPADEERQDDILIALLERTAMSREQRKSAAEIARRADSDVRPETFKRPLAELVRKGLLHVSVGSGGGYWLSKTGAARATMLRTRMV